MRRGRCIAHRGSMVDATSRSVRTDHAPQPRRPGLPVRTTAVLMAAGLLGFAAVNVGFELTGRFDEGPYASHAAGLAVMNWLVVVLKVLGALVAVLSVRHRPPVSPRVLAAALWAAFATLGVYVLGGLVEAIGMATGLVGGGEAIGAPEVGYLLAFLTAATGFGVLAVSFSRRHGTGRRWTLLGVLAGPAMIGLVLVVVPALLVAVGVMPGF